MENKQNLHTHCTYCDGNDTPEEMVLTAIEKGFDSIGFSMHSYMSFSNYLSGNNTDGYKEEINRLKKEYAGKIKIYLGLEFEYFSEPEFDGYDYLIGSVHYLPGDVKPIGFDRSQDVVKNVIDTYFNGDGMAYAKEYYKLLATLPERGKFDIIGHFDLITKHSDNVQFFDEESREYKTAVIEAAEALVGKIPFFEVNTGAIARGYRKTPYPIPFILKELNRLGFGAVITSDCHDKNFLDCHFEESRELLSSCGFKERYILTDNGFKAVAI